MSEAEKRFVEKICNERGNEVMLSLWVELKKKKKKFPRILVVGTYMLFTVCKDKKKVLEMKNLKSKSKNKSKTKLRMVNGLQLLDLNSIATNASNTITLKFSAGKTKGKDGVITLEFLTPETNQIIKAIRQAFRLFTNGFPNNRLPALFGANEKNLLSLSTCEDYGPAHGFIHTYKAYCCKNKMTPSKAIIEYITDLDLAGVTEFNLHDCPGIEQKSELDFHIIPISEGLRYNTYFRSLCVRDVPRKDILYYLSHIFRHNKTITKLVFSNLVEGNLTELFDALHFNKQNAVQIIDISGTHLTKGSTSLGICLQNYNHAISVLNLANTNLDGKQVTNLTNALKLNYGMSICIEELDLSQNKFDETANVAFTEWISKIAEYSNIAVLNLSQTGISISTVGPYFHFLQKLRVLKIGGNKLEASGVQLLCSTLEKSKTLTELSVSKCSLTGRFAAGISVALMRNKFLKYTKLDLSENEFTENDAEILASALTRNINSHTINLSKNRFKEKGLIGLLQSIVLSAVESLDTLILKNTFKNSYPGTKVGSALMSVINSLHSVKSLSLSGGFGSVVVEFLPFLETNNTLLELDISNNNMGDIGAHAISQLLRNNKTLLSLKCDGNGISLSGWKMILASFIHNDTLCFFDMPWQDYNKWSNSNYYSSSKIIELQAVLTDIQRALNPATDLDPKILQRFIEDPIHKAPVSVAPLSAVPSKLKISTSSSSLSSLAADKVSSLVNNNIPDEDLYSYQLSSSPSASYDEFVNNNSTERFISTDINPESQSSDGEYDEFENEEDEEEYYYSPDITLDKLATHDLSKSNNNNNNNNNNDFKDDSIEKIYSSDEDFDL